MTDLLSEERIGARATEPIARFKVVEALMRLTSISGLRRRSHTEEVEAAVERFSDESRLWAKILARAPAMIDRRIVLEDFCLSEWLPMQPGRYHTGHAKRSRDMALRQSVVRADDPATPAALLRGLRDWRDGADHVRVFDPSGKLAMIEGGIGCVRLKSHGEERSHKWMFGASSSGIAHMGIPIALTGTQRNEIIDEIEQEGWAGRSVRGTLRFLPSDHLIAPGYGREVPQVYIEVDSIKPSRRTRLRRPEVTAAISFLSRDERFHGLQVSYVTFEPGGGGDMRRALDWLEQTYVRDAYAGRVLTDFDEQIRHFDHARFGLDRLLNALVPRDEAAEVDALLGARGEVVDLLERQGVIVGGDLYIIGNTLAAGPNTLVSGSTLNVRGEQLR